MSDNDNDGQMVFGDLEGLKLPDICLTGEEKPRKTSPRKPVPTGDRTRSRCVTCAQRWTGHVARMEQSRNSYRVLVGKPDGKRPLGRPRRRWEDIIKMDLREVGCDAGGWIALAEDRDQWRAYVRAVMNLRVP